MENYTPNSNRFKEAEQKEAAKEAIPEKRTEKIISGVATTRKKTDTRRFAEGFLSKDVDGIKRYIFLDVLIPAIKKAVSDIVTNGIKMLLYGEAGTRNGGNTPASKISYRSYFDKPTDREYGVPSQPQGARRGCGYEDILFDSRGEAEEVLMRMDELIAHYGNVSVADLYDMAGISGRDYTDYKYGWTNLSTAEPVRLRDGYIIRLPRASPLN